MTTTELVDIDLTDDERDLLSHGLNEYGGPIRNQLVMVRALGLPDRESFDTLVARLGKAIWRKEPLSKIDWARAVFLTEVSWASNLVGSGLDFRSNFHDDQAAPLMRSIQGKIGRYGVGGNLLLSEQADGQG
ncbi:hypothetical protein OK015_21265 [Mycobacterium sp. Aquia_216]|uniref:hypothetical protein n=1 Tax=Mycobacterium sp. Aquia_216 TaxID=2991729 RepID=UPI00227C1FAE|nr:hypothetical protein [Mycobacterium sp. Aquia_216]WAJ43695.1 hypothetical protein OK015_21265 [Mycobacterium sp. Aquia_216]